MIDQSDARSLFDPSRLSVPGFGELIAASPWVSEIPGLAQEADKWLEEIPALQPRLVAQSRRLARPSLDASMALGVGRVAGNVVLMAIGDLLAAMGRPEAATDSPPPARHLDRIEQLVRAGGPAWVKLGQFIATAGGLLPDEWVEAFAWCRDEVPHLPPKVPRRVIRRAFGRRVGDIFAEFDDVPIGAASIAQVHRGVLHDGREVVVKVRRPGLRERFASDIRAMAAAAWASEKLSPVARAGNPSGFVELFALLVLEELDFRIEALNMVELGVAAEHADADYVRFPRPIPGLVDSRVLVMEKLPGSAYTSVEVDEEIGRQLLRFAIQGVLEHTLIYGVFHGDLHAGNVLLDVDTGRLSLVDFGIVGRLEPEQRMALGQFLVGFAHMNVRAQLEAMVDFGAIPPDMDLDFLVVEIEREVRPHDLPEDADVQELADRIGKLVQVVARHGVRLPKELVLFFKNLLYLNGFAASVAPEANLLGEITPVFGYFQQKYGEAIDLMAFIDTDQPSSQG
jgi:ubiquinone biosynthesis protein